MNEALSTGQAHPWTVHVGPTFTDTSASLFYRFIETITHNAITGGCTASEYCPRDSVTRAQMAVFVLAAKEGAGYSPAACVPPNLFGDVPAASPFCRWVEELARRGITAGCGGGNYCPADSTTRGQMAAFLTTGFGLLLYAP